MPSTRIFSAPGESVPASDAFARTELAFQLFHGQAMSPLVPQSSTPQLQPRSKPSPIMSERLESH